VGGARAVGLEHRVCDADVGTANGSARREVVQPNQGLRARDADVIRNVGDLETYELSAHGRRARLLDRGDVIAGRQWLGKHEVVRGGEKLSDLRTERGDFG